MRFFRVDRVDIHGHEQAHPLVLGNLYVHSLVHGFRCSHSFRFAAILEYLSDNICRYDPHLRDMGLWLFCKHVIGGHGVDRIGINSYTLIHFSRGD